jgi:hypothetical protein
VANEHPRMALPVTVRRYLDRGYLWSVEDMNSVEWEIFKSKMPLREQLIAEAMFSVEKGIRRLDVIQLQAANWQDYEIKEARKELLDAHVQLEKFLGLA